jgi:uncharacterized protein
MFDFSIYDQKEPEVYARKCSGCGKLYYPAPMLCGECSERRDPSGILFPEWETVSLSGKCELLTWTRVWNLPEGYDVKFLMFGIVEFENGLRASGRLEVDEPETGMKLEAKVGMIKETATEEITGFFFEAAS